MNDLTPKLFDRAPRTLFGPLGDGYAELYWEVLATLYAFEFEREPFMVMRTMAIEAAEHIIRESPLWTARRQELETLIGDEDVADIVNGGVRDESTIVRALARRLITRVERSGWVHFQYRSGLGEILSFHPYAARILEIVKFDAKTFPEAFAPSGRTIRASLLAAASKLEEECCLRIARHVKGPLTAEPREIRLGPEQVRFAYAAAQELGYEPLLVALEKIDSHAAHLLSDPAPAPTPAWMREFLERLRDGLKEADPSILGMKRERLKREWRNVQPALTASLALAQGIAPAWERVVSERLYNDSKLLGRIRSHVVAILVRADPRWEGVPPEEAPELLEAYGVRRKPGLIRCAGAGRFRIGNRSYDLRDFQPVAHLPETWAEAWVDAVGQAQTQIITTIENEYPFFSYVEESGGPDGLGARSEVALYTAGFPTPGLMSALRLLCKRFPSLRLRHWGDADVGGLRIWWFLRSQLQRPIELFRTTSQWLDNEVQKGGTPLSSSERAALRRLQGQMEGISDDDVSAARDLIESLSHHGLKLEQERY